MADSVLPAVRVHQQLLTETPSTLLPFFELCLIGPAYQIVEDTKALNANETYLGHGYRAGEAFEAKYPTQILGTKVDVDYVKITLEDPIVKVFPKYDALNDVFESAGTLNTGSGASITTIDIAEGIPSFTDSAVRTGDIVSIKIQLPVDESGTAPTPLEYTASVRSVETARTITLSRNIPKPSAIQLSSFDITFSLTRPIDNTVITSVADKQAQIFKLPASITAQIDGVLMRITSGSISTTFRALRSDLSSDFVTIKTVNQAYSYFGKEHKDNPLAVACTKVYDNVDISFKCLPLVEDSLYGYRNALKILSNSNTVYVLVPLSQDTDVINLVNTHNDQMSTAERSRWRISYASPRIPSSRIIIDKNNGAMTYQPASGANSAIVNIVDSVDGKFVTQSVGSGDYVKVWVGSGTDLNVTYPIEPNYALQITDVLNESIVSCSSIKFNILDEGFEETTGNVDSAQQNIKYEVVRKYSTAGMADHMTNVVAKSYRTGNNLGSKLRLVLPDIVDLSINGVVEEDQPGYYLCAALGAMRAGFPPHQGFTTMGISGFTRLKHSNKFFDYEDFKILAAGGIYVVAQDNVDSLPYVLFQTTVAISDYKTREDSVVATIDYASMFYRDNLKSALGKFNVNEITLQYVSSIVKDVTSKLKRTSYPYIGSVILSGELVSMATHDSAPDLIPVDGIGVYVRITVPFPCNFIDLFLQI